MKHRNGSLRKVFSLIAALGMFASTSGVGLFLPQVAEATEPTNDQGKDKGEIWVCKTLLDAEENLIEGSDNSQKYTIKFSDGQQNPTFNFNGALKYNTDLFSNIPGNDAECQKTTLKNALVGNYYYGEESIHKNPEMYEAPLYHDGYQGQATLTSQLGVYDTNDDVRDGHIVLNKDDVRVLVVLNQLKEVQNEVPTHANLHATKVVCEDEADLPNWGAGGHADITATTAQDWVDGRPDGACEIVSWDFQWAPSTTTNPGDSLGNQASWNTFTGSTTIPEGEFGDDNFVWVREVFDEDYVPFTGVNTDQHVSAEVYCAEDGLHYDNYDMVQGLEVGKDYYCVGFNALKDEPTDPGIGRCELDENDRWAASVKSYNQGDRKDGTGVLANRSDTTKALGLEDDADVGIDFYSLGFGGEIVLEFNEAFVDAPGDDIKVYETSHGNPSFASYPEQARVYVSSDGDDFTFLGIAELDTSFDLADIPYSDPVKFIKLVDISEKSSFGNDADGFDLAGIEVLACEPGEEPTQCVADLNLLNNPGFESPVVSHSADWNIFASGLEWLVEWMTPVSDPAVANAELHAGVNGWSPSEGVQYIELDSDYDGPDGSINGESASTKISQTVDTVAGETYTLTYDFSPRPGASLADNTLKVWVDGVEVTSHSADGVGNSNTVWETFSQTFVAAGATTTISFSDGGTSNSNGTFLDNTSLTCVPDPVTPEEPKDNFSVTGNKTEVRPESEPENGEGWTIYLLDLDDLGSPLETLDVDSTSDAGTDSSVLTDGEMYLVEVSGDYKFGNANRRADAEYSSELGNWTDAAETHGDKLDLLIDGGLQDWGVYTSTHTYYAFIEGDGTSVNFVIDDTPRNDNAGSLTVNIYELDGLDFEITDSDGNYSFVDLEAGNYLIFEERRDGWEQIGPDRPTDHCAVSFEEGTGTQTATCDFVNEGEEREVDDNQDEQTPTGGSSSGTSGQILGARLSTSGDNDDSSDDDSDGEVRGAAISYPGLPNAGVAPAVELVRTATSLGAGFTLYSLTTRRTTVLRKKAR